MDVNESEIAALISAASSLISILPSFVANVQQVIAAWGSGADNKAVLAQIDALHGEVQKLDQTLQGLKSKP